MTAIIGVLCRDGAVIGTDSAVTFGGVSSSTIEQSAEKLHCVNDLILMAGTGYTGHATRFQDVIKRGVENKMFEGTRRPLDVCRDLNAAAVKDFRSTGGLTDYFGALVAFPLGRTPVLCEYETRGFQMDLKDKNLWYCSMGSGQQNADPMLALMREVFWVSGPPLLSDAIFAVTWALDHTIKVSPTGVTGPARIAVLEPRQSEKNRLRPRMLRGEELDAHRSSIKEAKDKLREWSQNLPAANDINVPRILT